MKQLVLVKEKVVTQICLTEKYSNVLQHSTDVEHDVDYFFFLVYILYSLCVAGVGI